MTAATSYVCYLRREKVAVDREAQILNYQTQIEATGVIPRNKQCKIVAAVLV